MIDWNAITADWKNIGDDIRVALGYKEYQLPKNNALHSVLGGIRTINPFGVISLDKYNQR